MAPFEQWALVAQRYAERRADVLVGGHADLDGLDADERLDIRAEIEAAGFEAFREWYHAPTGGVRHAVDVGCRNRLGELVRRRAQDARAAPFVRVDGLTAVDVEHVAQPIVERTVAARYRARDAHDREEMRQRILVRTVDRVMRRFTRAHGRPLHVYTGITVAWAIREEIRTISQEHERYQLVDDVDAHPGEDDELEQAEYRVLVDAVNAWARRPASLTERERVAWFDRQARGGVAGDERERRAFADALAKVRAQFAAA